MSRHNKIELRIKKGKANTKLKMGGVNAIEPMDVNNRFVQSSIEGSCGQFCNECDQFAQKLCEGCYVGCHSEIRHCMTTECDVETSSIVKDKTGNDTELKGPCLIRCCKRNNLNEWIDDVSDNTGTLSIQGIRWEPFPVVGLPAFIPSMKGPVGVGGIYYPIVSISLSDIYRVKTDMIATPGKTIQEMFGLHPDTKVILNAYCADPIIERFWTTYREKGHLQTIRAKGIEYAMGFNYSVYYGHPRMEHLINIRRNMGMVAEMQRAGLKVIPDLCWFNDVDLDQYIQWINYNKVSVLGVSLQLSRDEAVMARNLIDLKRLQDSCPDVKKWIINGPSKPYRIKMLMDDYRDLIFMNKYAHQLASYRLVWDFESATFVKQINENGEVISRKDALKKNCDFFTEFVQGKNHHLFHSEYFGKQE